MAVAVRESMALVVVAVSLVLPDVFHSLFKAGEFSEVW